MSTPDIDILKLLDAGISPAEILRQIRSPAKEEMRRRCALVRSFDFQIYEMLSAQLEECPEFEMFVQQPDIQAVPRQAATYTLCSTERDRYLEQWTNKEHYHEWIRWNNKIAAFYKQHRPGDLLNRLYHLIPGQPKKAIVERRIN